MSAIIKDNDDTFIAMTIQYRLGAFGFLSSKEVHEKGVVNAGLQDQAYALQWVQDHIKAFGGDPKRVTISGESAGVGSVMLHDIAKGGALGNSLFQNSIAASPYLPAQYNYDAAIPETLYRDFADKAGCSTEADVFACLRQTDSLTLQTAGSNVSTSGAYGTWSFVPVTDGFYIQSLPSQALFSGRLNGQRILVGNNANEGPLFVPANITTQADLVDFMHTSFPTASSEFIQQILATYPSSSETTSANEPKYATDGHGPGTAINVSQVATGQQQRAYNIYAEATFVCPSYWLAQAFGVYVSHHDSCSRSSFKYQYSVPFASHTEDITAYFGPSTPNQGPELVRTFRHIFGQFIENGNASRASSVEWPTFSEAKPVQLNLNQTGGMPYTAITNFGAPVIQFQDPGLRNDFTLADAYAWEGGRGARCEFWKRNGQLILK